MFVSNQRQQHDSLSPKGDIYFIDSKVLFLMGIRVSFFSDKKA